MSNIKIINATAEDFAIEAFSSEPSGTDVSGDHQDGRIVKYLKNVYMWHDSTGDWIKFPNTADYDAFQADLSTQEVDRATAVSSLVTIDGSLETRLAAQETARGNAIDSIELVRSQAIDSLTAARSTEHANLSSELSTQISARVSAVDSEQARAESVEAVLSGALVTAISDREDDISAEKSRAESAEAVISGALVTAISDREDDVSAEKSRAESAQAVISGNISSEASSRASADSSLQTRLSTQEAARSSEYSALTSKLSSDVSDRSLAHSTIQGTIDGVEANLDAILLASTSNLNQFSEIVSYINQIDVAHDSQLSAAFSELTSGVASAELARSQEDSTLQASIDSAELARTQEDSTLQSSIDSAALARSQEDSNLQASIDSAELARTQEDSILHSSIVAQTTAREEEYSTIASNISVEAAARASQDTLISQAIVDEASTELVKEGSLEDVLSEMESTLQAVDVVLSNELSSQISNQGSANLELSGDFTSQLNSMIAVRSEEDSTLQAGIDSAELARQQQDSVIQSALDVEESVQLSQDASLEVRISAQEVDRADAYSVMNSSLDSAELVRSQEDSALTSALAVENSRIDAMLANASIHDGETLDTFVELVSFLTEVDTESDDALDSYVSSIDSSIAAENSELLAMRDAQSAELSSQISVRGSALDSLESRSDSAETSIESNISALESVENGRHLTINFSSATSLTVNTADLPSGFTAGNGMVQIFREVSTGTYAHLVAPSTFNPSTGEMTFDLGSTAKTGFAVFYSFASDDQASGGFEIPGSSTGSSSSSSNPDFKITDVTLTTLGSSSGDDTVVTFDIEGMTSSNFDTLVNYDEDVIHITASPHRTSIASGYNGGLTASFNSDYSKLTVTSTGNRAPVENLGSGYYYFQFAFGSGTSGSNYIEFFVVFNSSDNSLYTGSGIGKNINDNGYWWLSPPYIDGSGTLSSYSSNVSWWGSSKGPEFVFSLDQAEWGYNSTTNNNWYSGAISTVRDGYFGHRTAAVQFTKNGTDYHMADFGDNFPSSGDLYDEVVANRTAYSQSQYFTVNSVAYENGGQTAVLLKFGWHRDTSSSYPSQYPDANSIVTFYIAPGYDQAVLGDSTSSTLHYNWRGNPSYASAIKIVIDLSDNSYEIYRDSNVGGTLTWTSVSRCYLSNQDV